MITVSDTVAHITLSRYRPRGGGKRIDAVCELQGSTFTVTGSSRPRIIARILRWAAGCTAVTVHTPVRRHPSPGLLAPVYDLFPGPVSSSAAPTPAGVALCSALKAGTRAPDVIVLDVSAVGAPGRYPASTASHPAEATRVPEVPAEPRINGRWVERWVAHGAPGSLFVSPTAGVPDSLPDSGLTVFTDASVNQGSGSNCTAVSIVVPQLPLAVGFRVPRSLRVDRDPTVAEVVALCAAVDLLADFGVPLMLITDSRNAVSWWSGRRARGCGSLPSFLWAARQRQYREHRGLVTPAWVRGHAGTLGNEWADRVAKTVMHAERDRVDQSEADRRMAALSEQFLAACPAGETWTRSGELPAAG